MAFCRNGTKTEQRLHLDDLLKKLADGGLQYASVRDTAGLQYASVRDTETEEEVLQFQHLASELKLDQTAPASHLVLSLSLKAGRDGSSFPLGNSIYLKPNSEINRLLD